MQYKENVSIVGYGDTEYHKKSGQSSMWYVAVAIKNALKDAGLTKDEVDGLAVTSFLLPPDNTTTVGEHLGMELRWINHGVFGGASGVVSILQAARAIQCGDANTVVCVAADNFNVESHMEMMDRFNAPMRDYLAPYGFGGANGLFALLQTRHMFEYGTTREQLGKLSITQRKNAQLNENALLRSSLSLEDYLNARVIADPIHLYDCVMPCSGGHAVVLTKDSIAKDLPNEPIKILAGGQKHNHRAEDIIMLEGGWADYSVEMFEKAGVSHGDLDFVQLYDDYPIMEVIQLEDLGFCNKGDGGRFIEETDISLTGKIPVNTGGGQLSCGQCGAGGGMIGVTEAVRQLRNEAGQRQVKNAQVGLVSGYGMVSFVKGLSTSAMIITKE